MTPLSPLRLPPRLRLLLLGGSVVVGLFTFIYARLVCSFICTLSPSVLARSVILLGLFHVIFRELLLRFAPPPGESTTFARRAWLLSVFSWLLTGLLAIVLHALRYPTFPMASHLKFAVGYWLLGGGLIAQMEYLLFERALTPKPTLSPEARLRERLGRRLIEGYVIFTTVPVVVLMLTLQRFIYELRGDQQYLAEASLLALGFTGGALAVAVAYGRSLRRDSERLLEAVRRSGRAVPRGRWHQRHGGGAPAARAHPRGIRPLRLASGRHGVHREVRAPREDSGARRQPAGHGGPLQRSA
jgi:adenylate cyclase